MKPVVPVAPEKTKSVTLLLTLWDGRKRILLVALVSAVLTAAAVLLMTSQYAAETTILPELEKNKLLGMTSVSELAAATGLSVGEAPVSKLYPMIIESARILREVIYSRYKTGAFSDSVNLIQYWRISGDSEAAKFEECLKTLRRRMAVTFDNRLGTLSLIVEMEEPQLAATVANNITSELDIYTRTKRRTSVTAQREFIEQRLSEVTTSLKASESVLKDFREKNRRVTDSPQLLLDQARLERDLQINSTIFIELKKQIEIAKIEEIKNIPVINVLDRARVPVKSSYPRRRVSVTVAFLFGFLLGSASLVYEESAKSLWRSLAIRRSARIA